MFIFASGDKFCKKRHIVRVVRVDVNGILSIVEQTQTMPPRVCVKHFPGPTSTAPICKAK